MGTLSGSVISTSFKKLVFTNATSGNAGTLSYTLASDGTTDTELTTLSSKMTFTNGVQLTNGTIFDTNGNEEVVFTATGTAVNHLGVSNSATGNAVTIATLGSDSNVGLTLVPKGTGVVTCTPKFVATAGIELDNNIIYASDGATSITTTASSGNVLVAGTLTSTGDLTVNGGDATIKAANDDGASILLQADNSDDAGDDWKIRANSGQTFTVGNDIASAGSFVTLFTITPHATAASSNVTIAGDLTISGGNITNALTLDSTLTVGSNATVAGNLTFTGARDIIFTDASGLEIKDTGGSTYFAMISDTITASQPMTCSGRVLLSGNTGLSAGTGITGASGEVYNSWIERFGNMIKTSIYIDINSLQANGDQKVIGKDGGTANCHLGQITAALNGAVIGGQITCLETPATGDRDIDLCFDDASDGAEAADLTGETDLVERAGDWAVGEMRAFGVVITANNYLYLRTGTSASDATYSAGKFLIEIWGTV